MSLEDVKAGDFVWLGLDTHATGGASRRIEIATIARVTPKRVFGSQGQQWHRSTGKSCNYWKAPDILEVATADEVAAYETAQAQKKATTEAAEREREKAREEKRGRLVKVIEHLNIRCGHDPAQDFIEFELDGYKYRIEEAAHREE